MVEDLFSVYIVKQSGVNRSLVHLYHGPDEGIADRILASPGFTYRDGYRETIKYRNGREVENAH